MPTLTLVLGLTQLHAEASSLLAILPTAAAGVWRQRSYGNVRWRAALVLGLGAVAGRRGRRADRRVAARARAAAAVRGADARRRRPARVACPAEAALCFLTWPAPTILDPARRRADRHDRRGDPGGAPRDRRAGRLAAQAARVPHVRLHPRRDPARPPARRERRRAGRRRDLGRAARAQPGAPREVVQRGASRSPRRSRPIPPTRTSSSARATRSGERFSRVRQAPPGRTKQRHAVAVFADNAGTVGKRLTIFVALAGLLVLLTGAGGAGGAGSTAGASARAVAIRVVVPGQAGAEAGVDLVAAATTLHSARASPIRPTARSSAPAPSAPRPRATPAPPERPPRRARCSRSASSAARSRPP